MRARKRERPLTGQASPARANPARDAARAELRETLRAAIATLPEDQRDLFTMKYVAGMGYRQIGHVLGLSENAVGQKLWRIRQKLQKELEDFRP